MDGRTECICCNFDHILAAKVEMLAVPDMESGRIGFFGLAFLMHCSAEMFSTPGSMLPILETEPESVPVRA